ncbi:MAG: hypothetical protein JOY89_07115 [Solirubrobacterales bacterium]|nr:hypothetical protein [Solirubrobacterales bacterium]
MCRGCGAYTQPRNGNIAAEEVNRRGEGAIRGRLLRDLGRLACTTMSAPEAVGEVRAARWRRTLQALGLMAGSPSGHRRIARRACS